MRKFLSLRTGLLAAGIAASLLWVGTANADDPPIWTAKFTPAKTSATADNANVAVAIRATSTICTPVKDPNVPVSYATSQECVAHGYTGGVAYPASNAVVYLAAAGVGAVSAQTVTADVQGNGSVMVHSGQAGTMTLSAYYTADFSGAAHGSVTISFTAPGAAPVDSAPKAAALTAPATATPVPAATPSVTPTPSPTAKPTPPIPKAQKTSATARNDVKTYGGLVLLALWIAVAVVVIVWFARRRGMFRKRG